jgi:hypothetical protein
MFLRRFQKRKNGKSRVYWALAETYRTAKGPRHQTVSYSGALKESERSGAEIVTTMENKHGKVNRIWVMARGW